jgi:hypothetical protein
MRQTRLNKIQKASTTHNNFYDYSKLPEHFKSTDKVIIICPKHGDFIQRWNDHIAKCGCSVCGIKIRNSKLSKSVEYYKTICHTKHHNKYDYSLWLDSLRRHSKVTIICPIHGKFEQLLNSHANGNGCRKCGDEITGKQKLKGLSHYKQQANKIHNNTYDYSLWKNNIKTTHIVKIVCPIHGKFEQILNSHLCGRGCNQCKSIKYKHTCENKYGVSHIKQKNIPLQTLHKINNYEWMYSNHITQKRSPAEIAHKLNLSPTTIHNRLDKLGIEKKYYYRSSCEKEIEQFLLNLIPNLKICLNVRNIISQELDIYLPDYNLAIEYNGLYWHSEKHKAKDYHLQKTVMCEEQNIRLIHIFEDEWRDSKQKCIDTITHLLGYSKQGTFARHTHINEISWKSAKEFLNKYHLLNAGSPGNYRIGAFDKDNKLIGVMVFGQQNNESSDNDSVELRRFVTNKKNNPGLGSKMFKYAITRKQYKKIIAFVDRRWFTGLVKTYIGFKLLYPTEPALWWTDGTNRYHRRFQTKKQLITEHKQFTENMTKVKMLSDLGIFRIYDSGKLKLEWKQ